MELLIEEIRLLKIQINAEKSSVGVLFLEGELNKLYLALGQKTFTALTEGLDLKGSIV